MPNTNTYVEPGSTNGQPGSKQFDTRDHVQSGSQVDVNVSVPRRNYDVTGRPATTKGSGWGVIGAGIPDSDFSADLTLGANQYVSEPSIVEPQSSTARTSDTTSNAATMGIGEAVNEREETAPDGQPVIPTQARPAQSARQESGSAQSVNDAGMPTEAANVLSDDGQPNIPNSQRKPPVPRSATRPPQPYNQVDSYTRPDEESEPPIDPSRMYQKTTEAQRSVRTNYRDIKEETEGIEKIRSLSRSVTPAEPKEQIPLMSNLSTQPIQYITDKRRNKIDNSVKQKRYAGSAVWSVIVADESLSYYDISISLSDLKAMIREPNSVVCKRIAEELEFRKPAEDQTPWTAALVRQMIEENQPLETADGKRVYLADFINSMDILVYAQKDPVTSPGDAHTRRLRIHDDTDALKLHPLAAKLMNADHDGDRVRVDFRRDMLKDQPFAVDLLVQQNGVSIDWDFAVIYPFDLGMTRDTVESLLGSTWCRSHYDEFKRISSALYKMSHTNDKDEFSKQWRIALETLYNSYGADHRKAREVTSHFFTEYIKANSDELRRETAAKSFSRVQMDKVYQGAKTENPSSDIARFSRWMDLVVNGEIPNNWQAFCNAMGYPIETVEGKNAYFRLQGIGKAIRIDPNIAVGLMQGDTLVVDENNFQQLLNATMQMKMVASISNVNNENEEAFYEAKEVRQKIIEGTAIDDVQLLPANFVNDYGEVDYHAFIAEFVRRSDIQYHLISNANIEVRTNYRDVQRKGKFSGRFKPVENTVELVDRLLDVYGDMTMRTLFGSNGKYKVVGPRLNEDFFIRYGGMTLNEFVRNNTERPPGGGRINDLRSHMPGEKGKNGKQANITTDILDALILKRTSQAATYRSNLEEAAENVFDIVQKVKPIMFKVDKKGRFVRDEDGKLQLNENAYKDQTVIEHALRNIALLHYEAFMYHGIDNPFDFLNSKYGQAILTATSPNDIVEIRTRMVIDMRVDRINKRINDYKTAYKKRIQANKNSNETTIEENNAYVAKEIAATASSSPFWRIVIADLVQDGALFQQMIREGQFAYTQPQRKDGTYPTRCGAPIESENWNMSGLSEYGTFLDFLIDSNISIKSHFYFDGFKEINLKDGKEYMISDMVQFYTGVPTQYYEMFYQMDQDSASSYTTGRYGYESNGYNDIMEKMKSLDSVANGKWNEHTYQKMLDHVKAVREKYTKSGGKTAINKLVRNVAKWRSARCMIGRDVYADSLNGATMYKEYGDTEKNRQKFSLQFIFNATFLARNGMLISDFEFIDDLNSGRMRKDVFLRSPAVIAMILSDPTIELEVYDEHGSKTVSCQTLGIDNSSEEAFADSLWDFFEAYPRVAMAFRNMRAMPGEEGSCHLNAIGNLNSALAESLDTVDMLGKIRDEVTVRLIDHPSFASICVAAAGVRNHTTATMRNRYNDAVYNVVDAMLWRVAGHKNVYDSDSLVTGNPAYDKVGRHVQERFEWFCQETRDILADLGIDPSMLRDYIAKYPELEEGNEKLREKWRKVFSIKDAKKKEEAKNKLQSEKKRLREYRPFRKSQLIFKLKNPDGSVDLSTIRGINDCEQMLAGAKTATSTGVNGAETKKLGLLPYYLMQKPPQCKTAPIAVPASDITKDYDAGSDHYTGWHEVDEKGNHVGYLDDARRAEIAMWADQSKVVYVKDPALCSHDGQPCVDCAVDDGTLTNDPTDQISAAALMTIIYRTDSTEKNNLKIRKTGVEAKSSPWYDSISRLDLWNTLRRGDNDWFSKQGWANKIQKAYQEGGLPKARRVYANHMMRVNAEAGYEDMSFNQYVNVAQVLLREVGEEGAKRLEILSIHQIANIINKNLSYELAEEIQSADDMFEWCNGAINNYLENMTELTNDDLFTGMVVQSAAFGALNRGTVLKQNSSVERNYQIMSERFSDGIASVKQRLEAFENSDNEKFKNRAAAARRSMKNFGKRHSRNRVDQLDSILYLENEDDYAIPIPQGPATTVEFVYKRNAEYDEAHWKRVDYIVRQCERFGTTMVYDSRDEDLANYLKEHHPIAYRNKVEDITDRQAFFHSQGSRNVQATPKIVVPWFNIALNGDDVGVIDPSFNVGTFMMPASRLVRVCASTEINNGDSHLSGTPHFYRRTQATKEGSYEVTHRTLFSAWVNDHGNSFNGEVEIVEPSEISNRISRVIDKYKDKFVGKSLIDAVWADPEFPDIDLGYFEPTSDITNSPWHKERYSLWKALDPFFAKLENSRKSGREFANCQPGDLIGFAKAYVREVREDGSLVDREIWSPIRPYELAEGKGTPRTFDVSDLQVDPTTNNVVFNWKHESSLEGHTTKFFEGSNPANKMMLDGVALDRNHQLVNGQQIDMFYHYATTASRRTTRLRHDMLRSLFMEARYEPFGYNFAEMDEAFPDPNDEMAQLIKTKLLNGTATMGDWCALMNRRSGPPVFIEWRNRGLTKRQRSRNRRLNAFIIDQVNRCIHCGINPTVFLASRVTEETENGPQKRSLDVVAHWDVLFSDNSVAYQDNALAFFDYMIPGFCPPNTSYEGQDRFFVIDPDTKTLMRMVQYFDPDGVEYWVPQHVITDYWFGDDHYSGFCRAYVGPSHKSVSSLLASALWNVEGKGADISHLIEFTEAEYNTLSSMSAGFVVDPDQDE